MIRIAVTICETICDEECHEIDVPIDLKEYERLDDNLLLEDYAKAQLSDYLGIDLSDWKVIEVEVDQSYD
jgi:hypothetical protein